MAVRARLLKKYQHENKDKSWAIGTIIQGTTQFISELIHKGIAEKYSGEYPPKNKMKTDFFKPKK